MLNLDYVQPAEHQLRPLQSFYQTMNNNNNNNNNQEYTFDPKMKRGQQQQQYVDTRLCDIEYQQGQSQTQKDHIILHVRNLDYKISSDEWRRILTENFKKHCKDVSK
jgi:hypothetical protein